MKKKPSGESFDILIIGGGPAGLCFARALADAPLKIALVEKSPESILANPPYDGREIALTHASRDIMRELGLWDAVKPEDISLIRHAKVLNGTSPYALHFDHHKSGKDNLGFMMSNHVIRHAAYTCAKKSKNLTLLTGVEVSRVSTGANGADVTLSDGRMISCQLVVAADSRFSTTRRQMGIAADMLDFGRVCIVCKMRIDGNHEETALECFFFDRTLAILPLNNHEVSVVITLGTQESAAVLSQSSEEFSADITRRAEGKFGRMTLSTALHPYPLVATYARTFCTTRYALIGDAAVGMHPVTAHGFNLGLKSAKTLAADIIGALETGGDFAAPTVLQDYSLAHRRASRPLYLGTNALVKLYTSLTPTAKFTRALLLRLGNRLAPAKRVIMNQLTESA